MGDFIHVKKEGLPWPAHFIIDWKKKTIQLYGFNLFTVESQDCMSVSEAEAFAEAHDLEHLPVEKEK